MTAMWYDHDFACVHVGIAVNICRQIASLRTAVKWHEERDVNCTMQALWLSATNPPRLRHLRSDANEFSD